MMSGLEIKGSKKEIKLKHKPALPSWPGIPATPLNYKNKHVNGFIVKSSRLAWSRPFNHDLVSIVDSITFMQTKNGSGSFLPIGPGGPGGPRSPGSPYYCVSFIVQCENEWNCIRKHSSRGQMKK